MMTNSDIDRIKRDQHYLPKAYLQFFANDGKNKKMTYIHFLNNNKPKYISIDNICKQAFLYEEIAVHHETDEHLFIDPNQLENSFVSLEGKYASVIRKLLQNIEVYDEPKLSEEDCDILKQFISSTITRSPLFVHISNYITQTVYGKNSKFFMDFKSKFPEFEDGIILSLVASRFLNLYIHPQDGILSRSIEATMNNAKLCILKTNASIFITSDSPVVNICGEKDGFEFDLLGMPITPNLFLSFIDTDYNIPEIVYIDKKDVKSINNRQNRTIAKMLISSKENISSYIDINSHSPNSIDDQIFDLLYTDKETILKMYSDFENSKDNHYWQ